MKSLAAFIGGAIVGAAAAALYTPQTGDETRAKVREVLKKYGIIKPEEEDTIIEQIVAEIRAEGAPEAEAPEKKEAPAKK